LRTLCENTRGVTQKDRPALKFYFKFFRTALIPISELVGSAAFDFQLSTLNCLFRVTLPPPTGQGDEHAQ